MTLAGDLLQLARLAQAVYIDDPVQRSIAVMAAGFDIVAPYETEDHRALFCSAGARLVLVLCGTRFSDGNEEELFDDIDESSVCLPYGQHVMAGFHRGMQDLYSWAMAMVPAGAQLAITGHSLGGARGHLAPVFIDPLRISQITTFGAPKAANRAYWATRTATRLQRVVNARDLWAGWPFVGEWCHADGLIWLDGGSLKFITEAEWPGGRSLNDHSIDTGYVAGLEAIAASAAA